MAKDNKMSRMNFLFRNWIRNDEGPACWWSWQDLRRGVERKGPPPPGFCTNGRAWLHWPGQSLCVQWVLFSRRCALSIEFSTTDDDNINFNIGIPFIISLYFSIGRAKWVQKLPGVKWNSDTYYTEHCGDREISLRIFENALWWRLWRNPGMGNSNDWRDDCFHFDDFFLGRPEYLETHRRHTNETIKLPEGEYPVEVELYTSVWLRPRWPWPRRINRANVEIKKGIPVPGNPDCDFFDGEDALFSLTCPAETVEEALGKALASVLRDRGYDLDWRPE